MRTRIEPYRKEVGLTQEQLAEKVGVARQTIISLEQGRYNPSLRLAVYIARALKRKHVEEVFEVD
jgi:putative transcriptional regulator